MEQQKTTGNDADCPLPRAKKKPWTLIQGLWRWRDSNSRPNAEPICFLHAYSGIGFCQDAGTEPPTKCLSRKISEFLPGAGPPIFDFLSTTLSKRLEAGQSGDVSFLPLWQK